MFIINNKLTQFSGFRGLCVCVCVQALSALLAFCYLFILATQQQTNATHTQHETDFSRQKHRTDGKRVKDTYDSGPAHCKAANPAQRNDLTDAPRRLR